MCQRNVTYHGAGHPKQIICLFCVVFREGINLTLVSWCLWQSWWHGAFIWGHVATGVVAEDVYWWPSISWSPSFAGTFQIQRRDAEAVRQKTSRCLCHKGDALWRFPPSFNASREGIASSNFRADCWSEELTTINKEVDTSININSQNSCWDSN